MNSQQENSKNRRTTAPGPEQTPIRCTIDDQKTRAEVRSSRTHTKNVSKKRKVLETQTPSPTLPSSPRSSQTPSARKKKTVFEFSESKKDVKGDTPARKARNRRFSFIRRAPAVGCDHQGLGNQPTKPKVKWRPRARCIRLSTASIKCGEKKRNFEST